MLAKRIEQFLILQMIKTAAGICFSDYTHADHQLTDANIRVEFQKLAEYRQNLTASLSHHGIRSPIFGSGPNAFFKRPPTSTGTGVPGDS